MSLENFKNRKIEWDTVNKNFDQSVQIVSGDVNSRTVTIVITDNGEPINLTGYSVKLIYKYVYNDISGFVMLTPTDAPNGEFSLTIPTEMTSPGSIKSNLILLNENLEQVIVSKNLKFISDDSTVTDLAQEVNNKIDDFTKLLLENMPQVMRSELNDLHAQTDSNTSNIDLKANSSDMTSLQSAMNSLQNKVEAFGITPENLVTIKSLLDAIANSATDSEVAELINSVNVLTSNISLMSNGDYSPKANKTEMAQGLANKVDKGGVGQVTWSMASQDFRQKIADTVVGKDSVITDTIVDKAVTTAKTNFVDADVNIANPANILNGYRYAINNGIVSKISDSERKCILIPVASGYWYSMNIDTYSTNFSHAVDESMKQVSLLGNLEKDSASIFKTTSTTRFIAITVASTADLTKLVVMQKRDNILNYTANECPYNQPINIKIPGLQVGGSPVEELKNPSYKDVISKGSEILKASKFIGFFGGAIIDNTWSGSGQYQGMYTRPFESNFEETMIDIDVTISGLTSVDVMLRYRNSADTFKYISLFEATSSFKTTLSFDASNLAIYNDAKDFAILVRNTGTNVGSFTIDNLLVYTDEMRKTSFYADNLKEVLLNIDEQLKDIKPTEETILTSPSGKKFKLMISDDGNLTAKVLAFSKINISGNSLVNGIYQGNHGAREFGMCASDSRHDFNYLVKQAILAKNTDATFTQTQISGIEMATSQETYEAYRDSIANSYTADTDLIILQIGDNTTQYIETFENTFPQFLAWLKGKCPIADIVVVGTWFSKAVGYPVVKQCASDAGLKFVDISALNTTENQSTSGAIITYDDGTTVTASESWVRHPGNVGMQKIADKIIESVGI